MCGRYASTKSASDVAQEFRAIDRTGDEDPGPDHNVAPTKPVLAVVQRHPRGADGRTDRARTERTVRVLRWGLVPYWAKDPSGAAKMINARAETAVEKPSYRAAMAARRCLLPADGWYEWKPGGGSRQPYYVHGGDGASLAMAGLWEFWRSADGQSSLLSAAVLTTAAVGPLADIHHRMPLLLSRDAWDDWLDPDAAATGQRVAGLLAPPSERLVAGLELRPVSTLVNNVRNTGPELTDPATAAEPAELQLELG
jgi:putative SOS response-associated peptidase YedK